MDKLAKQQACQLLIDQEIDEGLEAGKTAYSIGKDVAALIEKIFNAKIKPDTIRIRARRQKEKLCTNVHSDSGIPFETCALSDLQALIAADKKFGTIYADPPWKYSNQSTRAATDNHYETMTPAEIAEMPISQLTAEKAHLHLSRLWGPIQKKALAQCKLRKAGQSGK